MKRTGIILLSIGLNLVLLAVVASQRNALARLKPSVGLGAINPSQARAGQQPELQAAPPDAAPPPTFNWKSVESEDYKTYIRQLRAIGCPEETIRDIIAADVRKLFDQKREALLPPEPPKYWETKYLASLTHAQEKQLHALDQEEKRVLDQLLGADREKSAEVEVLQADGRALLLDGLPAETRDKIREWKNKFDELESEILQNLVGGRMTPTDEQKIKELRQQRLAELAVTLRPEELEQFQVRNSNTADQLRDTTAGLQLSEEEFLRLFRLQKSVEEQKGNGASRQEKLLAEQQVQDQIKQVLGEQRYAEFQRNHDSDYYSLNDLAQRFELPEGMSVKVYDLHKAAREERKRIESSPGWSDQQRAASIAELKRRTDSTIAGMIGDNAFKAYRQVIEDTQNE